MTTLAITTLCDGDCDLFPFWIEHYRSLGVDRIVACIDRARCPDYQVHEPDVLVWEYELGELVGGRRDEEERLAIRWAAFGRGSAVSQSMPDWILYTDLDEHQEYQGGLHAALAKADEAGRDIVMGVHCDRLAADGSFPELPKPIDLGGKAGLLLSNYLDLTFPARTNISRDLIGVRTVKVMAAKPGVIVRPGRHGTKDRPFAGKTAGILDAGHLVHHFKWRAGVLERIRRRMKELPAEYNWYRERYGPFLAAIEANGGRVPV